MQNIILTNAQYKRLKNKMEANESLLYILSESKTIPGEWESRLMFNGRMLAYSSRETGGNIFPKNLSEEKANELISDFGIHNLVGEEVLLLIEAKDYNEFLKKINQLEDKETSRILKLFFYDYQQYFKQSM